MHSTPEIFNAKEIQLSRLLYRTATKSYMIYMHDSAMSIYITATDCSITTSAKLNAILISISITIYIFYWCDRATKRGMRTKTTTL